MKYLEEEVKVDFEPMDYNNEIKLEFTRIEYGLILEALNQMAIKDESFKEIALKMAKVGNLINKERKEPEGTKFSGVEDEWYKFDDINDEEIKDYVDLDKKSNSESSLVITDDKGGGKTIGSIEELIEVMQKNGRGRMQNLENQIEEQINYIESSSLLATSQKKDIKDLKVTIKKLRVKLRKKNHE